jgi:ubiquinone biosynthesis protein
MVLNMGPMGRLRDGMDTLSGAAERLPRILEHADRAASLLSADGLRLHPDTLKAMRPRRNPLFQVLPWGLVAVLATLLIVRG